MGKKMYLEFEGFEEVISRLAKVEGNVKEITNKALKKTHEIITKKSEEAGQKQNLPAKGKYSDGDTLKSLHREGNVEWAGTLASVDVGFSIRNGGLASIFMIYGTPRHMKNQKMYNAIYGKSTLKEVVKAQEDIFYEELRRLNG